MRIIRTSTFPRNLQLFIQRQCGFLSTPRQTSVVSETRNEQQLNERQWRTMMKGKAGSAFNYGFMLAVLMLNFSESAGSGHGYGNATSTGANQLRFRRFEPRHNAGPVYELANKLPGLMSRRAGRGFHFHTTDEDLSVELEFIVPFFEIPVHRSMSLARETMRGLLDLQTGALLNTALIVAGGGAMLGIIKLISATLAAAAYGYRSNRNDDFKGTTLTKSVRHLTDAIESKLVEHNVDIPTCIQRYICKYLSRDKHQPRSKRATLIDALLNLELLHEHLNGTAVFSAIDAAKHGTRNCERIYRKCNWPHFNLESLRSLSKYFHIFNG